LSKDQELLIAFKNPKQKDMAFGKLLDVYQELLYWHIRKIVVTHENADDVLQNTFLRIYRSIEKFQKKSSLLTWMYRIAYNESIRFVEKNKRFQFEVMLAKMDRI
jgi:RNA polymerase sigma-70 factor (ECF subfamily)